MTTVKCVGAAQTCQRQRCVSLLVAGGLGDEHRCRDGNVLSMRIGGGREGVEQGEGEKRKREAEGSKGFTARSLAFQVMDTLVLV